MQTRYPHFFNPSGTFISLTFKEQSSFSNECCNDLRGHFLASVYYFQFPLLIAFMQYIQSVGMGSVLLEMIGITLGEFFPILNLLQ